MLFLTHQMLNCQSKWILQEVLLALIFFAKLSLPTNKMSLQNFMIMVNLFENFYQDPKFFLTPLVIFLPKKNFFKKEWLVKTSYFTKILLNVFHFDFSWKKMEASWISNFIAPKLLLTKKYKVIMSAIVNNQRDEVTKTKIEQFYMKTFFHLDAISYFYVRNALQL